MDSLSSLLSSIEQQAAEAEALQKESSSLMGQLESEDTASAEQIDSYLHQVVDGLAVFNDQVAELLSEELVTSIHKELENARTTLTATATMSDGSSSDLTDKLGSLEGSFSAFKSSLDEILQQAGTLDTAVKASWDVKANVK